MSKNSIIAQGAIRSNSAPFLRAIVLKLPDPAEDVSDALPPWKQVAG